MEVKPSDGNLQNVVAYVSYTRQVTETINGTEYSAQTSGIITCPEPNPNNFIPYNNLTKEEVNSWLDEITCVSEVDKSLDSQIQQLSNPPLKILPLPF